MERLTIKRIEKLIKSKSLIKFPESLPPFIEDFVNVFTEDEIKLILNYIEQLEKENNDLKLIQSVFQFDYDKFKELKKENAELKKQLQAKDKALDKACGKISRLSEAHGICSEETCNRNQCDGKCNTECENANYWKEWAENGID